MARKRKKTHFKTIAPMKTPDWMPMYTQDPNLFNSYIGRDLSDLFYDAMKIWFIAFLMIGWAGLVIRFVGWLFGG